MLDTFLSKLNSYKLIRLLALNLNNKVRPEINLSDINSQDDFNKPEEKMSRVSKKNTVNDKKEAYLKKAESFYSDRKFSDAEKTIKEIPGDATRETGESVCF